MDQTSFNKIRKIVYEKSGIAISDGKQALVSARIGKRMRSLGIDNFKSYVDLVLKDRSGEEVVGMLDAISTNVTSFFREADHFTFLTEVFSKWVESGQRRFRLWSAASSSGEEPYTIAMILLEVAAGKNLDIKILATDISTRVLTESLRGCYEAKKMTNVPRNYLSKYFEQSREGETITYAVKNKLKDMIVFKRLNLSTPPFPMKGPLDVIFCRNVMIYFDNVVRARLLKDMYRLVKKDGYLLVGHAESLTGMVSDFQVVRPSVYIKS